MRCCVHGLPPPPLPMDALLRRATSDDPTPTPVTIYTELAWHTHNGDRETASRRMVKELGVKLASPFTPLDARLKVLLTMKHVATKGSLEVRRFLQAHKELLREHVREWHESSAGAVLHGSAWAVARGRHLHRAACARRVLPWG